MTSGRFAGRTAIVTGAGSASVGRWRSAWPPKAPG
jgi:hypothetical protein